MKSALLTISLVLSLQWIMAQPAPVNCPYNCTRIPFQDYSAGMRFLFPSQNSIRGNTTMFNFRKVVPGTDSLEPGVRKRYSDLAGNEYYIDRIKIDTVSHTENRLFHFFIYLTASDRSERICYTVTVKADDLTGTGAFDPKLEKFTIEGAVYVNELNQAAGQLTGNYFYTVFPVNGIRYTKVKITKVLPGTLETPIRVVYEDPAGKADTVALGICGTNVPGSFVAQFHFTRFFSCTDQHAGITTPQEGMSTEEVRQILGPPQNTNTKKAGGTTTITYTYPGYKLIFTGNKLVSIEQ